MDEVPDLYLENNLFRFYEDFIGFEDYVCDKSYQYDYIFSEKYQWPGYVYNIRPQQETSNLLIEELDRRISCKELPPFLLVDQKQAPQGFDELLDKKEIKKIGYWPVIYFNLKSNLPYLQSPRDFTLVEVRDENQLKLWFNIVAAILFPRKTIPYNFFKARINNNRYIFYLGYYKEIPVTTCMLFLDNSIAGAYMGATIKDYRNMGFGSEIVARSLLDASKAGCDCATAQSNRSEFHVWENMGFSTTNVLDIYWKLEL
jgi:ribosomal protein S18 acetylase RimI-like enzyme